MAASLSPPHLIRRTPDTEALTTITSVREGLPLSLVDSTLA